MKLRNLSLVLFFAACGGGKDGPQIVDSPSGDGGGTFPNSRNDVVLAVFGDGFDLSLTPDSADEPDNQAAPLAIDTSTTGFKLAGEFGIAGDRSDSYFERDTFLITTGPTTNQLTVRFAWDGGTADNDFFLFEELTGAETEIVTLASGTLISDTENEFQTFTVDPNTNYWLWAAPFETTAAGGAPSLPLLYDFAVYGDAVSPATTTACNAAGVVNEGTDTGNNQNNGIVTFGGAVADKVANNVTVAPGTSLVVCGTLNEGNFLLVPEATDPTSGTDDVDAYAFSLALEQDILITIIGQTDADQTAIQALLATGALQVALFNDPCVGNATDCPDVDPGTTGTQPRPQQFFGSSLTTYLGTHGVTSTAMLPSNFIDPEGSQTDQVGPKTVAVFLQSNSPGILTADINYKLIVSVDNREVRAPRINGSAAVQEANDN